MHAEGFAAGELKHGPIALIEDGLPVIVVMPSPKDAPCCTPSCCPTSARSRPAARVTIVIAEEGDDTVRPVRRPPDRDPAVPTLFPAAAVDHPAAGVRRRGRPGPRLRRRQAAQPGQVRHRRVGAWSPAHGRPRHSGRTEGATRSSRARLWPLRRPTVAADAPGPPTASRPARAGMAGLSAQPTEPIRMRRRRPGTVRAYRFEATRPVPGCRMPFT